MNLFFVVWFACSIAGLGRISTGGERFSVLTIGGGGDESEAVSLEPSSRKVERRISKFDTRDAAIDFAEHTKYKCDCSTTAAKIYELVEIAQMKSK